MGNRFLYLITLRLFPVTLGIKLPYLIALFFYRLLELSHLEFYELLCGINIIKNLKYIEIIINIVNLYIYIYIKIIF